MIITSAKDAKKSKWMRLRDAEEYYGISVSTLRRWGDECGAIRRTSARMTLIDTELIDAYINAH